MNSFVLRTGVIFLLLMMNAICLSAQTSRFIYLQTENKEGFYVKLDKKVLNATPSGYLIIPKLADNTYPLTIGFYEPGQPEITVSIRVRENNLGFLLRNSTDKGWALLNLHSMQPVVIKKEFSTGREEKAGPNISEFSRILAEVVDEPSIAWAPVPKEEDIVSQPVPKTEDNKTVLTPKVDSVQLKKPAEPADNAKGVAKAERKAKAKKTKVTPQVVDSVIAKKPETPAVSAKSVAKAERKAKEKKAKETPEAGDSVIAKKPEAPVELTVNNVNCKKTASQKDYLKLRRQMAGEENEKDMIKAANKQFLNICYTTDQVKNLGILFINEEEKYKFFVAAYPHISDTNNFGILKDQLTDNYYRSRLEAMMGH